MANRIPRRAFLTQSIGLALTSGLAGPVLANAPLTSLRPRARDADFLRAIQPLPAALIERAGLGGSVGFAAMDLTSGEVLETGNAAAVFPPASVAKALTAAYALDTLGPDYRFLTTLSMTGSVSDGVLNGDLTLTGGGDPTLDTDRLADMVAALKTRGITKITGQFFVSATALPTFEQIDPAQPRHVAYNPAVSGLNLNYNRVHFGWQKAGADYSVTMEARSDTNRPPVRMARMRVVPRQAPIYTYENGGGRDNWTVAKSALGNAGSRWLPVRKPAQYAGETFQSLARAQGIDIPAPTQTDSAPTGETIALQDSGPLRVILRDMLKWSTNLTAEIVGLAATQAKTGAAPASLLASAQAMNAWAAEKFDLTTMAFVDHSGLGDASRISPEDMVRALRVLRQTKGLKPLMKPFAMRDAKRRVIQDHPLSVRAKTGTLNFVSGLAGFVDLPDGRELVFAIFTGDLDRRSTLSVEQRENPDGARSWNRRAKTLQQALIERWGIVYAL